MITGEERVNKNPTLFELDDEELITRIVDGEKELFRIIIDRYQRLVMSMIGRQVSDNGIVEDLSQEVFVKAFLNLNRFRGDASFSTWLVRIALNHTNSYFRSRSFKEKSKTGELQQVTEPAGHDTPEDIIARERKVKRFQYALAQLSPVHRDVLTLCALEGKPYEEVAQILSIPVGTVRSRLNKARLLMKELVRSDVSQESSHE